MPEPSKNHPAEMVTKGDSRVQMTQVAVALLSGKTTAETAAELGLPKTRVERWRRDPGFKDLYAEVESKLASDVMLDASGYLTAQIERLLPAAVAALENGLASEKVADQLNAAGKVLQLAKPARETTSASIIPIEAMIRARATDVSPTSGD